MYIQQLYPSLADILWKQKNKTKTTQMSSKRKRSEKKVKFRPALQDKRYLVTASNLS